MPLAFAVSCPFILASHRAVTTAPPTHRPRRPRASLIRASLAPASPRPSPTLSPALPPSPALRALLADPSPPPLAAVRDLIIALESTPDARPETALFADFALTGTWELIYSSSPRRAAPDVRVRTITQRFGGGAIVSDVAWTYLGPSGDVDAVLSVEASYVFPDGGPVVEVEVSGHKLKVEGEGELPADLKGLVERLQGCVPMEIWDPAGKSDPATFMDPGLRIACALDERIRGLRTVFRRCDEERNVEHV